MKRAFAYFLTGILAAVVGLELILRVLPVSTSTRVAYYIDPLILTYPAHHTFWTATGWDLRNAQRHRSNNYGFLTSRDFSPDPNAIALIGDSFVEASMLPEHDRVGGKLQQLLPTRPIYVLGGPGSNLLDYAERVRFAAKQFHITEFVIVVERGDVLQALCGSHNIHGPCYDKNTLALRTETRPPASMAKDLIRHSALAQYVFAQLKLDTAVLLTRLMAVFRPAAPLGAANAASAGPVAQSPETVDLIVDTFFNNVQRHARTRLVLVFDCKRDVLRGFDSASDPLRDRVMQRAAERGAAVIDLEPHFRRYVQETGLSLDVSPSDAHWNREANRIVAEQVASVLGHRQ